MYILVAAALDKIFNPLEIEANWKPMFKFKNLPFDHHLELAEIIDYLEKAEISRLGEHMSLIVDKWFL